MTRARKIDIIMAQLERYTIRQTTNARTLWSDSKYAVFEGERAVTLNSNRPEAASQQRRLTAIAIVDALNDMQEATR